jgi:hypothetical protein
VNQFSGIPKGTQQSFGGIQVGNEKNAAREKIFGVRFHCFSLI